MEKGRSIEKLLADMSAYGERAAVSGKRLSELAGCAERSLRTRISEERKSGALILSSTGLYSGYYLPALGEERGEEIEDFNKRMKRRAFTAFEVSKGAGDALKVDPAQQNIFED